MKRYKTMSFFQTSLRISICPSVRLSVCPSWYWEIALRTYDLVILFGSVVTRRMYAAINAPSRPKNVSFTDRRTDR